MSSPRREGRYSILDGICICQALAIQAPLRRPDDAVRDRFDEPHLNPKAHSVPHAISPYTFIDPDEDSSSGQSRAQQKLAYFSTQRTLKGFRGRNVQLRRTLSRVEAYGAQTRWLEKVLGVRWNHAPDHRSETWSSCFYCHLNGCASSGSTASING